MSLIKAINNKLSNLRKSERKVAHYVLEHLHDVIRLRITDLAAQVGVSEPTVIRFCRAVGCSGFQDFKMTLAQDIASNPSFGQVTVTENDTAADYCYKVFDSTINTLSKISGQLDTTKIDQAINALAAAKRVEFFGLGASGVVAAGAQHKFFHSQLTTAAHSDHHIQNMSATSIQAGDIVVAISQSGRTSALVQSLLLVKEAGGTVISISPNNTPVSDLADIPIPVNVDEETKTYTPLSSRIAHLVVIDVLAIGVTQRRGLESKEHL